MLAASVLAPLACAQPAGPEAAAPAGETPGLASAVFAGGCFWCMEPPFDALEGVVSTTSGYSGGAAENPTYEEVSAGRTGHLEAVLVQYDPARIGYEALLDVYWRNIDPLDDGGQFCDRGPSYRSAIFYANEEEKRLAEQTALEASERLGQPVATQLLAASGFYRAEAYHQDYYEKNPLRYKFYRYRCGRDERLEELWGGANYPEASTTR